MCSLFILSADIRKEEKEEKKEGRGGSWLKALTVYMIRFSFYVILVFVSDIYIQWGQTVLSACFLDGKKYVYKKKK